MPRPVPDRLVIATHNAGKLREFAALLQPYVKEVVSAGQLGLPSPEETGTTFSENALLKAKAVATASGSVALADDSGLCINALGGQPGIFSARWAVDGIDKAMARIQKELGNSPDRTAYFICVLALCWPDGHCETLEGRIDGTIVEQARGIHGHGYDPVFVPEGYTQTFAEMPEDQKNRLSHRGRATKALVEKFFVRETSV
ncbi:MAG: RdgB/HAM1 family non-canonical purine NTP pyrophosphatase [Alphaproteobacteria bacterium]|nr:RdgB/HAM1 family non-canonical purine NTP pyrophosphatase [Alphaproteobacteria bacterium]